MGDGAWGDWRAGSTMELGVGQRNLSAIKELAGELRDEGGRRAREKKKIEEERREKRSRREREKRKCLFNEKRREKCNNNKKYIYIYIYIFFTFELQCTSKIDVHYSCGEKSFRFSSTAASRFFGVES